MGVQADEAPDGEERAVEQLKTELNSGGSVSSPLDSHKFVARLLCGCVVGGETRASVVRVGSHGQWCETHESFSLFEDYVSTKPLTDVKGKA